MRISIRFTFRSALGSGDMRSGRATISWMFQRPVQFFDHVGEWLTMSSTSALGA